jgi:hypothetical protein
VQDESRGNVPRLWSQHGRFPGAAFTRSIGDSSSEALGVTAEPELVTQRLSNAHPFFVIASDGVWEFLTSQQVVDMIACFDEPREAAEAVACEAFHQWRAREVRRDDITIIVVQVAVRTLSCSHHTYTGSGIGTHIHSHLARRLVRCLGVVLAQACGMSASVLMLDTATGTPFLPNLPSRRACHLTAALVKVSDQPGTRRNFGGGANISGSSLRHSRHRSLRSSPSFGTTTAAPLMRMRAVYSLHIGCTPSHVGLEAPEGSGPLSHAAAFSQACSSDISLERVMQSALALWQLNESELNELYGHAQRLELDCGDAVVTDVRIRRSKIGGRIG